MTDIFSEVEADLRRERAESLWRRFGGYVILAALVIVVGVGGWRGYIAWQTERERTAGDTYLALVEAADGAHTVDIADQMIAFSKDAPGDVGVLARLRAATVYEQAGEADKAKETLRAVADDTGVPELYRNVGRLKLGQVLIDGGDLAGARDVLGPMAQDAGNPFNAAAQELIGVAAYVDGDLATAKKNFTDLTQDVGVTAAMRDRARAMLDLIAQVAPEAKPAAGDAAGGAVVTGEADAAAPPAQETN